MGAGEMATASPLDSCLPRAALTVMPRTGMVNSPGTGMSRMGSALPLLREKSILVICFLLSVA